MSAVSAGLPAVRANVNLQSVRIMQPEDQKAFRETDSIPIELCVDAPSFNADDFYFFRCGIQKDWKPAAGEEDFQEFIAIDCSRSAWQSRSPACWACKPGQRSEV